jgi:chaperonin GroES
MSTSKLKPLGNRVVIQKKEALASKGGILLPETAKEKPRQGTVIAVGTGKTDDKGKLHPLSLKTGDVVLFSSYAGSEYTKDGVAYLIISEDDILATVKE